MTLHRTELSNDVKNKLIPVGLFFVLLVIGAWWFPALLTKEEYSAGQKVRGDFPIAVEVNSVPTIIQWYRYAEHRSEYDNQLFIGEDNRLYKTGEFEWFSMKNLSGSQYSLEYHTDDYNFFAVYSIVNGKVSPESIWLNGPGGVFYGLVFATIGTLAYGLLRRLFMSRSSSKGVGRQR